MLLTRTGVSLVADPAKSSPDGLFLQINRIYCTKGFAELFFSEFLMNHLRISTTRSRLVVHFLRCGCKIAEMLPDNASFFYDQLAEKIIFSKGIICNCQKHIKKIIISKIQAIMKMQAIKKERLKRMGR